MSELAIGWAGTKIGDLCNLVNGRAFKPTDWGSVGLPIIRIQNLNRTDAAFNHFDGSVDAKFLVRKGDLLFAWSGTPGTSFGAHIWNGPNAILNQHIFNVRYNEEAVDKAFFRYAINQTLDEQIAKAHGGVGLRHVTKGKFEETEIALPPLPEQRRIVAKIDTLSAKSRRARGHLDHIPRLVEKYKQAILAAAFRGDLTREWRSIRVEASPTFAHIAMERAQLQEAHRQRLQPCDMPALPDGLKPFDVPSDWAWVRAEAICGFITKGTTPKSAMMSTKGEIPFIKVYNLTFDGTLDFTVEPTFVSRTIHEGFLARSKVIPGDVLMNIVGPPLGKVSVVPNDRLEWNINQAIAVFRPIGSVSPVFLSKWLLTDVLTRWAVSRSKATAGQSNLTLEICRDLPIPLCSLAEQQEIVRRIQTAFAWIDRLASETTSAHKLIDHLDQAILAKAFRGELVPQDPSDEPASELLERIKAGRLATPILRSRSGTEKTPEKTIKLKPIGRGRRS